MLQPVPDDVGRRFRATRVLALDIQLTEQDVADALAAGDTAEQSAEIIASLAPDSEWTLVHDDVVEL